MRARLMHDEVTQWATVADRERGTSAADIRQLHVALAPRCYALYYVTASR